MNTSGKTRFSFTSTRRTLTFAGLGLALLATAGAEQSLRAAADTAQDQVYKPIQAISYELGSKRAVGHFARTDGRCELVLMVAENVDLGAAPEIATPSSAARLRVTLEPGQAAGLDSEEGRSIDLTCGPQAKTLSVREGNWIAATL